jgi:hypothetical protein
MHFRPIVVRVSNGSAFLHAMMLCRFIRMHMRLSNSAKAGRRGMRRTEHPIRVLLSLVCILPL